MRTTQHRACRSVAVLAALAATRAAPAFAADAEASPLGSFVGVLVALAIVLVVAWLGLRLLRQAHRRGWVANGPMTIRATLPLGMREKVVMVEVGGRMLILGVTAQQISLLRDSPAFDPGAERSRDDAGAPR